MLWDELKIGALYKEHYHPYVLFILLDYQKGVNQLLLGKNLVYESESPYFHFQVLVLGTERNGFKPYRAVYNLSIRDWWGITDLVSEPEEVSQQQTGA